MQITNTNILVILLGILSAFSIFGAIANLPGTYTTPGPFAQSGETPEDIAYDKSWSSYMQKSLLTQLVAGILVAIAAWLAYSGKSGYVAVTLGAVFALGGINGLIAPPHPLEATQDPNYRG